MKASVTMALFHSVLESARRAQLEIQQRLGFMNEHVIEHLEPLQPTRGATGLLPPHQDRTALICGRRDGTVYPAEMSRRSDGASRRARLWRCRTLAASISIRPAQR